MYFKIFSLLVALFIFIGSQIANAEHINVTLLKEATATGAGEPVTLTDKVPYTVFQNWSCDIVLTGSPTAVVVRIEGNQGGTVFGTTGMTTHTCSAQDLTDGICQFAFSMLMVKIRANLITLTGGTSPKVTVICTGGR